MNCASYKWYVSCCNIVVLVAATNRRRPCHELWEQNTASSEAASDVRQSFVCSIKKTAFVDMFPTSVVYILFQKYGARNQVWRREIVRVKYCTRSDVWAVLLKIAPSSATLPTTLRPKWSFFTKKVKLCVRGCLDNRRKLRCSESQLQQCKNKRNISLLHIGMCVDIIRQRRRRITRYKCCRNSSLFLRLIYVTGELSCINLFPF